MDKSKLIKFIKLYNLGAANIDLVKFQYDGEKETLSTSFFTIDQQLLGAVRLHGADFLGKDRHEFGISNTKKLLKFLGGFSDQVEVGLTMAGEKYITLDIKDEKISHSFPIHIDLGMIPSVPKNHNIPDPDAKIVLDNAFIESFTYFKGAFADESESFVIRQSKKSSDHAEVILGYSPEINGKPRIVSDKTTISVPVELTGEANISTMAFKTSYFGEILSENKDAEKKVIKLSNEGLLTADFTYPNYSAVYYLIEMKIDD